MFGTEVVIPAKVGLPSYRVESYLDLLKEKRNQAAIRLAAQKNLVTKYYNSRVRPRSFLPGDLLLRKFFQNTQEPGIGAFGPNWEGPYKVVRIIRPGVYELENLGGRALGHPWNVEHLKKYYQ